MRAVAVAIALAAALHAAPPLTPASASSPPSSQVVEAETMAGNGTSVTDPAATGLSAVRVDTFRSATSTVAAGHWFLSARVRGSGAFWLNVSGQRVGAFKATSTWTTVKVPVHLAGPGTPFGVRTLTKGTVLDWVSLEPAPAQLTTRGRDVLDLEGQPVVLRGVQRSGLSSQPWHFSWNDSDFGQMAAWGARIVRIEMSQAFWLTSSCQYRPAYLERMDMAVESLTSRGVIALLDLHRGTQGSRCKTPGLYKMADTLSLDFWRQVAARYKDNPLVAFDLFNEPHDISDGIWRDGGSVGSWTAVGMQQLYDAVRSTGATNLVVVSGQGWATDPRVHLRRPLDGYGIIAGAHAYCLPCDGALPSSLAKVDAVLPHYPTLISEWGWNVDSGAYSENLITWAEERGIGWIAYSWDSGGPGAFALLSSWATYEPSAHGLPVKRALLEQMGS